MAKVTILCHPVTPVAPAELEDWLELQLSRLRSSAPVIVRLSRLTQALPSLEVADGWLIEVELIDESHPLDRDDLSDAVADVINDMRFLGMQPMLLFHHAVREAIARGVPGVLGIHIEGPFLSKERRGVHDASKLRVVDEDAMRLLATPHGGVTMVTLAPETYDARNHPRTDGRRGHRVRRAHQCHLR